MTRFGMPFLVETETVDDACALCARLGLSFVELNANFPACSAGTLEAKQLRTLRKKWKVDFTLHLEEECDPFSFTLPVRQAWLETLRGWFRLAKEAEIPLINMHLHRGVHVTLPDRKVVLYQQHADEYLRAVDALLTAAQEELNGSGVRIGIENTNGFLPHERQAVERLLSSPLFGLTLDIGHCHGAGDADLPFYRQHADRLIHMHGHDCLGRRDHLPLGDGEIDLKERFAWAIAQNAGIVLETKTISALEESVRRLPRFL